MNKWILLALLPMVAQADSAQCLRELEQLSKAVYASVPTNPGHRYADGSPLATHDIRGDRMPRQQPYKDNYSDLIVRFNHSVGRAQVAAKADLCMAMLDREGK